MQEVGKSAYIRSRTKRQSTKVPYEYRMHEKAECEWEKESTILEWTGKCQYVNEVSVKKPVCVCSNRTTNEKFLLFFHVPRVNLTFIFPAFYSTPPSYE
jgi:hypothetical protein